MRRLAWLGTALGLWLGSASAYAGVIQDENGKPGVSGSWTARDDGTARFDGVVDVYPAQWSIKRGEPIQLKVRSTTGFDVRVMRIGWYGGRGAREVKLVEGQAAAPQPYPTADAKFGLAEAKWATNVTIPTDASFTPGLYVARVEASSGKDAETFFVVRDDGMDKLPILLVVGLATHEAYNAWPGPDRGGKSLYGFNSSPVHPSDSIGELVQATRVSFDRPFLVGAGTADLANYEVPFVRWAEKYGYDVAYATDLDLHDDPDLAKGRRTVVFSGHEEYTTWQMFDNALAARDSGSNFLFLSGDTWSWQVRLEAGAAGPLSTMIGYKESWVKDPEQKQAYSLREAGNVEEAKKHFRRVSRGWKNLEYDPTRGIDERRPGMLLTGVNSAGVIRDAKGNPLNGGTYPWADLIVDAPSFWIFDGTGLNRGDKIPNVFGYEVDSTMKGSAEFDPFRPSGQVKFGTIKQVSDGQPKGAAGYYQKDLGDGRRVEVVAMSAIFTAWGLDDSAAKAGGFGDPTSPALDKMMHNVVGRWTGSTPIPPATQPPEDTGNDPGSYDPEKGGDNGAAPAPSEAKSGCTFGSGAVSDVALPFLALALAAALRRRAGR